jgi:hypothetical protein
MTTQLPLLPDVRLESSFEAIFGYQGIPVDDQTRRDRWARWLRIARKSRKSRDAAIYWTSCEGCIESGRCAHLRGAWCRRCSLPASVSPMLSFDRGMIGMACGGVGWSEIDRSKTPKAGATKL